uniref:Uncharacterized protein n=1 Tax=Lepeophtheirus salmonis TaxID=72036 RepID=A0A0K2U0X2_LEPSM
MRFKPSNDIYVII